MALSHLYFAQSRTDQSIKVGASDNVAQRLRALESQYKDKLDLLHVAENRGGAEHSIHIEFREDCIQKSHHEPVNRYERRRRHDNGAREWFRPSPALLCFIEILRSPGRDAAPSIEPRRILRWWGLLTKWAEPSALGRSRFFIYRHVWNAIENGREPTVREAIQIERVTRGTLPAERWGLSPYAIASDGISESFAVGF